MNLGTIIDEMRKDIPDIIGSLIPQDSVNIIIDQLKGMSGVIESNFSQIFSKLNQID